MAEVAGVGGTVLSWLVQIDRPEREVVRRGRLLVLTSLGLMTSSVLYLTWLVFVPHPGAVVLIVAAAVLLLGGVIWVIRRGQVGLGAALIMAVFTAAILAGCLVSGRVGSAPVFVALLVTMAGATLGVRYVVVAFVTALLLLGVLALINHSSDRQTVAVSWLILHTVLMCTFTAVAAGVTAYGVRTTLAAEAAERVRAGELTDQLREANAVLEARVAERTSELAQALHAQTALASELAELSIRDPLTGLHNRRHLDAEVVRMFEEAKRYNRPLCVAMVDLDNFKAINDVFGHDAGDEVLRRVARILIEVTRTSDLVARYGGEELAVVFPDTTISDGAVVCERVRERICNEPWGEVGPGMRVTTSIGLAHEVGQPTVWHLLQTADQHLYQAKAAGKNQVTADIPVTEANQRA